MVFTHSRQGLSLILLGHSIRSTRTNPLSQYQFQPMDEQTGMKAPFNLQNRHRLHGIITFLARFLWKHYFFHLSSQERHHHQLHPPSRPKGRTVDPILNSQ